MDIAMKEKTQTNAILSLFTQKMPYVHMNTLDDRKLAIHCCPCSPAVSCLNFLSGKVEGLYLYSAFLKQSQITLHWTIVQSLHTQWWGDTYVATVALGQSNFLN